MTQEEKQLLLKDLCARLPYGVKCLHIDPKDGQCIDTISGFDYGDKLDGLFDVYGYMHDVEKIKPYLRPMSSMTEEEAFEMFRIMFHHQVGLIGVDIDSDRFRFKRVDSDGHFAGHTVLFFNKIYSLEQLEWLNAHHFDYRGLIEKGLALEASEGMYKNG